jgi:hypothetical protein
MLSFPSLIPIPLALIPDAHNCSSFVPRNNSPSHTAPCFLHSALYHLSACLPVYLSACLPNPWLPGPLSLIPILFVSHSFFFRYAERNLSPKGIPHRPPHLSTCIPVYLSTSPSVLLPIRFFFETRNEYRALNGIANWTRVFLSGIITSLHPRICFYMGKSRKTSSKYRGGI